MRGAAGDLRLQETQWPQQRDKRRTEGDVLASGDAGRNGTSGSAMGAVCTRRHTVSGGNPLLEGRSSAEGPGNGRCCGLGRPSVLACDGSALLKRRLLMTQIYISQNICPQ